MLKLRTLLVACVCQLAAAVPAAADSIVLPVTVSTSGFFSCVIVAPCMTSGGNMVTIPSATGSATITFTGVTDTFDVTSNPDVSTLVTIGRFDVVATPGYTWPVAGINPVLSIVDFQLRIENPLWPGSTQSLRWDFGPGGGLTLTQRGPWNFGLPPDVPSSQYPAASFQTNQPILVVNQSTDITAQAGLVPEPTSMLLVVSGLAAVATRCRRRRIRSRRC